LTVAIYILIRKTDESDEFATYEFGPSEDRCGALRVTKASGETVVLAEVPGDEKSTYSLRACRKIYLHWKAGEFPDRTCWAA
jgi:hypothetical protein